MKSAPSKLLLPIAFVLVLVALLAAGYLYSRQNADLGEATPVATSSTTASPVASTPSAAPPPANSAEPGAAISGVPAAAPSVLASGSPTAIASGVAALASPGASATASGGPQPDLSVDANGLSKATVVATTSQGVIKFKFYPQDAPNTVNRIIQLVQQHFYDGLTFHRVVPGFVIQGGDPQGNGTGGSGVKLKAEFNNRRHIEGTVAMARAADPDSADSQFYISLGTHPHLDRSYTVFGQVIEGMDVARKIKIGDRIVGMRIE